MIETNKNLIIAYEEKQAQWLASKVIARPPLAIWYIVIPVIFVHYFYRLQKYSQSLKEFVSHYMRARKRAIEVVAESIEKGRRVNINDVTAYNRPPKEAEAEYRAWVRELIDHYTVMLQGKGKDFDELLRLAYRSRGNYLLFADRLNKTEQRLNKALTPGLAAEHNAVGKTIAMIEQKVQQIRREEADRIFS